MIMKDKSLFSYSKLLEAVEIASQQYEIEGEFVQRLLSMEDATSINYMIKTYNNIIKILSISNFESKTVPMLWYQIDCWKNMYQNLYHDLNQYFNECILSWFKNQDKPTDVQYKTAISNIRYSANAETIQSDISKIYHDNEDNHIYYFSILKQQHYFQNNINQKGKLNMNYSNYITDYIFYSNRLAVDGHIFDIVENEFAKQHDINYEQQLAQYKEALKRKEILKKEEQKKKERELSLKYVEGFSKVINPICEVIFSWLLALPFGLLGGIFSSMNKRR